MCTPDAGRVGIEYVKKKRPLMYNIDFTTEARQDLAKLEKSEPKVFAKAVRFIEEVEN